MIEAGELFENAIDHWRLNKGIGTALIPPPLNDKVIVLGVLQRLYAKNSNSKTIIITQSFKERSNIREFLTNQEDNAENNEEFKTLIDNGNIKILTFDFVKKTDFNYTPLLCVLYRPTELCDKIANLIAKSKFKLIVLNRLLDNPKDMTMAYALAPILEDFKHKEVEQVRLSTPVEEYQIGVSIPEDSEEAKLLDYYNEYITTSISIFGSFDILQQANVGNTSLNISSAQICYQIAQENGWNDRLDMSVEFNREIDALYNPGSLKERASTTYEIIRNRSQFLSGYKGKLDSIFEIVRDNADKRILIINKYSDFANTITSYINTLSEKDICMNYHDKVENIPAVDADFNPVYYKSGARKGERKLMGAKAQKTLAQTLFNKGYIRVLSTNNAPDKDLSVDVDIIIITSPMCEDISSYIYRMSNLNFRSNRITLYSIYCRNTTEQNLLERKKPANNHSVKSSYTDDVFSDFIAAD